MPQNFRVEHDSQNAYYRWPTGAVEAESTVRLRLQLSGDGRGTRVWARFWQDEIGEKLVELHQEKDRKPESPEDQTDRTPESCCFSCLATMPERGRLLWYYFIISRPEGTVYYGNSAGNLGGMGEASLQVPASYQITVYNKGAHTPDWFKHAVMYQIFPDRFCRKGNTLIEKKGAVYHASWQDSPFYFKDVDTKDIVAYDFFGGNLAGIRSKLSYLKELGISVIYLNPVFESATNHHYDTGDYHKIDPILGTNEEFTQLCREAKDMGIRILLDGVFSHTGSDSRYFNRYGTYPTLGAFQSSESPYYEWYSFKKYPYDYESWWGFPTLPNVKETTPSYMDFIINDEDSVLHHWMAAGISGWRLDVVDELPARFTQTFYKELKKTDPEAVLIGEVWEDASNKISYGVAREYLCGQELDSAMNYPFRQIVLDFLLGAADGQAINRRIQSLWENYPHQNFYAMMNLIGSHDRERILTLLGEGAFYQGMPAIKQAKSRLDDDHYNLGVARLRMAVLWQMTFPGVPSIYYGDEIGMQGFRDPYNRGPYDWENGDTYLRGWVQKTVAMRNAHKALQTGEFLPLLAQGDVYAYARVVRGGKDIFGAPATDGVFIAVFNRSMTETAELSLDVRDIASGTFEDILGFADARKVERGRLNLVIPPLMGRLYQERKTAPKYPRQAGVLLHPTSLPSRYGIGDLGQAARKFVEFLAAAGQQVWQILPLNPVGYSYSPYQSPSAFAGNPLLISLDMLEEQGLLTTEELKLPFVNKDSCVEYEFAASFKKRCLKRAWEEFCRQGGEETAEYAAFRQEQAYWLEDYALFMALKTDFPDREWTAWPADIRRREPAALAKIRKRLATEIRLEIFQQYVFFQQWNELRSYANAQGIRILGDMPIFVAGDSADVWAHQSLFDLDAAGRAKTVAGVPPDYFSATGQLWGNPQYDWAAMKKDGYSWWKQRFSQMFSMLDSVRVDHFRGFESYWEVPGDARTAIHGRWVKGPGKDFFDCMGKVRSELSIVAEDLGIITDEVDALRESCGFPGMKVLHFELHFNDMQRMGFCAPENSIVYTGTHDNNTTVGWFQEDLDTRNAEAVAHYLDCPAGNAGEICRRLVEMAYASPARLAMVPVQDILALDGQNRMNLPGTVGTNWKWCLEPGQLTEAHAQWLRGLCEQYRRLPVKPVKKN